MESTIKGDAANVLLISSDLLAEEFALSVKE
jgi:hypothetical protein